MNATDIALNEALETIAYLQRRLSQAGIIMAAKNEEIAQLKSEIEKPKKK